MKLGGLPNRAYNIVFHTHTVSGIVISFALYVIFFAGAYTLFRDEIFQWEDPTARQTIGKPVDYDALLENIKAKHPSFDQSDDIYLYPPTEQKPVLNFFGHQKPKDKTEEDHFHARYYPQNNELIFEEESSTIGLTLYRLHYFDQVPFYIGRYVSGFVALFFLFAVFTGVLIHWRNIVTKFYGFSLRGSLKQIWTSSHTVLGLLGLPFQLIYAITGAYYMLSVLILLPVVMVFFGGDQKKVLALLRPNEGIVLNEKSPKTNTNIKISQSLEEIRAQYPAFKLKSINLKHYDREDALITVYGKDPNFFSGDGMISIQLKDGKKMVDMMPGNKTYVQSVIFGIAGVHFATFGGVLLKFVYFFLAIVTCFVIISGVLLWKEARNKKNYTDKQKRFHHRVTMSYLAICFGLFPSVAILFMTELVIPSGSKHIDLVNSIFFFSWLMLTIIGLFWKTEAKLTRNYLYVGGGLSILVPIVNGLITNDWLWKTLANKQYYVAGTDLFWLGTGIICLASAIRFWQKPSATPEATIASNIKATLKT